MLGIEDEYSTDNQVILSVKRLQHLIPHLHESWGSEWLKYLPGVL
jgi:hypothetical protein